MRQRYKQLQGLGVEALCISFEPPEVLVKLAQELDLPFPILYDTQRKVYEAYGITQAKTGGDFVVDEEGRLLFIHRNSNPRERPLLEELMALLQKKVSPTG